MLSKGDTVQVMKKPAPVAERNWHLTSFLDHPNLSETYESEGSVLVFKSA